MDSAALFPPWANTAIRVVLAALALGVVVGIALLLAWVRSPLFTGQDQPVEQPLPFDHRHHVGDDNIDCRYCHGSVEKAASAGYPATEVCAGCHGQVWGGSPITAPIRHAFFSGAPLKWKRVHQLPDHVYFNHAIHLAKGVGCVTCHGRVDEMADLVQARPLTMGWCVDCHRDPTPHLRPRQHLTSTTWQPDDPVATGRAVAQANGVHARTSCTTCHR